MFGVQQMIDVAGSFAGASDHAARASRRFDSVSAVVTGELTQTTRSAFDAGNQMQRRMVDILFRGLTAFSPMPCRERAQTTEPGVTSGAPPGDRAGSSSRFNPFASVRSVGESGPSDRTNAPAA